MLERAVDALNAGLLVVIPTDTVYGIAARHDNPRAVARLFATKGRSGAKPLPILVSDLDAVAQIAHLTPMGKRLAESFWPGPLTIVAEARKGFDSDALAGESSVGLRMPRQAFSLSLIKQAGGSLAVSSANRSGAADSLTVDEAREQLGAQVAVYIDGGPAPGTQGSTVADARGDQIRILRAGPISAEQLRAALDG
jgi:L-threonylcarbamoyladenylate synthase